MPLSPAQLRLLHVTGRKRSMDHADLSGLAAQRWGVASLRDLNEAQLQAMLAGLGHVDERPAPPGRPRGRSRDEGVISMASPRQRQFAAELIGRFCGSIEPAAAFLARVLGDRWTRPAEAVSIAGLVAGIATSADARQVINMAVVECKRGGLWR